MTPAQEKSERWTDLAKAIESYWNLYAEPSADAEERARSVFTADDADVDLKLSELGTKFEVALPITPSSKAMAYTMRAYEIHRKDNQDTLEIILQRDFAGAAIKWLPLSAPKDLPYGYMFFSAMDFPWLDQNYPLENLWQTSRGAVAVDSSAALYYGFTRREIEDAIRRKLTELRPAHIVFDGIKFFSIHVIPVEPVEIDQGLNISVAHFPAIDADPFLPFRFDDNRLDDWKLDWFTPLSIGRREIVTRHAPVAMASRFHWRLDMGWEVGGKWVGVPGIEADTVGPSHFLLGSTVSGEKIAVLPTAFSREKVESHSAFKIDANPLRQHRFDDMPLDDMRLDRSALEWA